MCLSKFDIWQQAYQQYCQEVDYPLPYSKWLSNCHASYQTMQHHDVTITKLNKLIDQLLLLFGDMFQR